MENASKALIIAGAILVCIMIVAVGVNISKSSIATIETSMSSMSTQEVYAHNSKYTMYEGEQTGANIKSLVNILISNVKANEDETSRIPALYYQNNKNDNLDSGIPKDGNSIEYLTTLQNIRKNVDSQHKYWVEINYQSNGLIDYINISYDKNNIVDPMTRN